MQDDSLNLTPLQAFVLAHLTSEDILRQREGMAFGRPAHDLGHTLRYRYATNINELTTIVDPSLIPGDMANANNIMKQFENEIEDLLQKGFLIYENEPSNQLTFRGKQYEAFYITPKGKAFIRKRFEGLATKVAEKKLYEQTIEQIETGSAVKKYLKDLRTKFIDQTQDQIIETIMSGTKEYAPIGILALLKLMGLV